ncbi:MAG: hypothetical protein J6X86_03730 [Bacteroidales bacterium]|nr:hypothetical protein [Bacteroidales bacterium]
MKKLFSILMVAFAMTTMVACDKDNDNDGDGDEMNIADNTLVYDGVTYTFSDVMVDYRHSEMTLVSAFSGDPQDAELIVDHIHITPNVWNRDFDLTDQSQWPDDVAVYLILNGAIDMQFEGWVNVGRNMGGHLDGVEYEGESIFTSGTYRVSGNNDGTPITITVNGKLKNGKTLQMKIVSDNYDINK